MLISDINEDAGAILAGLAYPVITRVPKIWASELVGTSGGRDAPTAAAV